MQVSATSVDALTDELFGFVAFLMRNTQAGVFEVAGELDLTLSQLRALFVLTFCDHEPALTELAPAVGLSVAATGRLVDALVRGGHVSRREDEADRRVKRISLTEQGAETMSRLAAARREGLREFVQTLSDTEREQFSRALGPVLARSPFRNATEDLPK